MAIAAGAASVGRGGALGVKVGAGSNLYLPISSYQSSVSSGKEVLDLINNAAYPVNESDGLALGSFSFNTPLIAGVETASLLTSLFLSASGDTDAGNYSVLTFYPDAAGTPAEVHGQCKFSSLTGSLQFSTSGAASAFVLGMSGIIIDPFSGSAVAASAPSAGAISTGRVLNYAQSVISGASNVVGVSFQVLTGAIPTPGVQTGTGNALYPLLCAGALLTGLTGTVTVTQLRSAGTVLTSAGTLTVTVGTTGAGLSFAFKLLPLSVRRPSSLGLLYMQSSYMLKSTDGTTSPLVTSAL